MVVVVLRSAHRGAEQQEANPRLDEGEGGAVRVTSSHHHLRRDGGGGGGGKHNRHSSTEELRGWFHPLTSLTSQSR